jgi:hypothetical protein
MFQHMLHVQHHVLQHVQQHVQHHVQYVHHLQHQKWNQYQGDLCRALVDRRGEFFTREQDAQLRDQTSQPRG